MIFTTKRVGITFALGLGLTACAAPTLVSLQPIGAPQPSNSQQTFVDADGCSWWIVGNGTDLRWAPMTNSIGEHVCDGGATRIDRPSETDAPSPVNDGKSHFVQVATFALESNIKASESLFSSLGYAINSGSQARDNDRLYRLILGPFGSKDEAQKAVERAFNEGFDDAFPFRK